MAERETGTVKWFDESKGYGYVERLHGGDVYVHFRDVRGEGIRTLTLSEGDQVEFEVVQGPEGLRGQNVVVVEQSGGEK